MESSIPLKQGFIDSTESGKLVKQVSSEINLGFANVSGYKVLLFHCLLGE